jgi:hypothetical protein
VNCHINLLWHLILEQYQGLQMTNYALISLASKLSFPQCSWGFDVTHFNAIMMGYESFMVEVGLYGNTISYNYKKHSMLATSNTWLKNIWGLASYFNVWLNFKGNYHLKPVRWGNISFMSEYLQIGDFSQTELIF